MKIKLVHFKILLFLNFSFFLLLIPKENNFLIEDSKQFNTFIQKISLEIVNNAYTDEQLDKLVYDYIKQHHKSNMKNFSSLSYETFVTIQNQIQDYISKNHISYNKFEEKDFTKFIQKNQTGIPVSLSILQSMKYEDYIWILNTKDTLYTKALNLAKKYYTTTIKNNIDKNISFFDIEIDNTGKATFTNKIYSQVNPNDPIMLSRSELNTEEQISLYKKKIVDEIKRKRSDPKYHNQIDLIIDTEKATQENIFSEESFGTKLLSAIQIAYQEVKEIYPNLKVKIGIPSVEEHILHILNSNKNISFDHTTERPLSINSEGTVNISMEDLVTKRGVIDFIDGKNTIVIHHDVYEKDKDKKLIDELIFKIIGGISAKSKIIVQSSDPKKRNKLDSKTIMLVRRDYDFFNKMQLPLIINEKNEVTKIKEEDVWTLEKFLQNEQTLEFLSNYCKNKIPENDILTKVEKMELIKNCIESILLVFLSIGNHQKKHFFYTEKGVRRLTSLISSNEKILNFLLSIKDDRRDDNEEEKKEELQNEFMFFIEKTIESKLSQVKENIAYETNKSFSGEEKKYKYHTISRLSKDNINLFFDEIKKNNNNKPLHLLLFLSQKANTIESHEKEEIENILNNIDQEENQIKLLSFINEKIKNGKLDKKTLAILDLLFDNQGINTIKERVLANNRETQDKDLFSEVISESTKKELKIIAKKEYLEELDKKIREKIKKSNLKINNNDEYNNYYKVILQSVFIRKEENIEFIKYIKPHTQSLYNNIEKLRYNNPTFSFLTPGSSEYENLSKTILPLNVFNKNIIEEAIPIDIRLEVYKNIKNLENYVTSGRKRGISEDEIARNIVSSHAHIPSVSGSAGIGKTTSTSWCVKKMQDALVNLGVNVVLEAFTVNKLSDSYVKGSSKYFDALRRHKDLLIKRYAQEDKHLIFLAMDDEPEGDFPDPNNKNGDTGASTRADAKNFFNGQSARLTVLTNESKNKIKVRLGNALFDRLEANGGIIEIHHAGIDEFIASLDSKVFQEAGCYIRDIVDDITPIESLLSAIQKSKNGKGPGVRTLRKALMDHLLEIIPKFHEKGEKFKLDPFIREFHQKYFANISLDPEERKKSDKNNQLYRSNDEKDIEEVKSKTNTLAEVLGKIPGVGSLAGLLKLFNSTTPRNIHLNENQAQYTAARYLPVAAPSLFGGSAILWKIFKNTDKKKNGLAILKESLKNYQVSGPTIALGLPIFLVSHLALPFWYKKILSKNGLSLPEASIWAYPNSDYEKIYNLSSLEFNANTIGDLPAPEETIKTMREYELIHNFNKNSPANRTQKEVEKKIIESQNGNAQLIEKLDKKELQELSNNERCNQINLILAIRQTNKYPGIKSILDTPTKFSKNVDDPCKLYIKSENIFSCLTTTSYFYQNNKVGFYVDKLNYLEETIQDKENREYTKKLKEKIKKYNKDVTTFYQSNNNLKNFENMKKEREFQIRKANILDEARNFFIKNDAGYIGNSGAGIPPIKPFSFLPESKYYHLIFGFYGGTYFEKEHIPAVVIETQNKETVYSKALFSYCKSYSDVLQALEEIKINAETDPYGNFLKNKEKKQGSTKKITPLPYIINSEDEDEAEEESPQGKADTTPTVIKKVVKSKNNITHLQETSNLLIRYIKKD